MKKALLIGLAFITLGVFAQDILKLKKQTPDEEFENILDIIISTFNLEKMEVNNQITLDGEGC